MIVPAKELHKIAYKNFSIGAFNIHNLEQLLGLMKGNEESQAPFILQIFPSTQAYTDSALLQALIRQAEKSFPDLIFAVNLDHGDETSCMDAINSGLYSSVMIDASLDPFERNIEISQRVVEYGHSKGVSVEAMLGRLGGKEEHMKVLNESETSFTDPEQAKEFIKRTGCDSLAVSIGNLHGAYKSKDTPKQVNFERLKEIHDAIPNIPLVLHGSSCLPTNETSRIETAGGKLDKAGGMDEEEQSKVVQYGVAQININTDAFLLWTRVHREYFRDVPNGIDLREPGKIFMSEYAKYVQHKNEVFGSAHKLDMTREMLKT